MFLRYSSSVVAPITCSSPRASAGFSMFAGVHRALGRPGADDRVHLVDEEDDLALGRADLVDHRLQPLLELAAVLRSRRSARRGRARPARRSASVSGTSSLTIRCAIPSTIAVLPTPGSPISAGLFFVRRERISIVCSISSARPITGSSLPSRAVCGQVAPELVELRRRATSRAQRRLSTPRITAPRSFVCETPKRCSSWPAAVSSSRASASSTCSGPTYDAPSSRDSSYAASSAAFASGESDGDDVGPLALLGLLLDLRGDRVRIGIDLAEHVPDDVVLERGVEQVVGVEVEAAPLDRRLRRPLQELARRVAEELRHVDRSAPGEAAARPHVRPQPAAREEIGEEVVEEAAAAETARHPLFRETIAEVLRLGLLAGKRPLARRNRGPL